MLLQKCFVRLFQSTLYHDFYFGVKTKVSKFLTFSFIGGDQRQLYAASLIDSSGYHVRIYGFGTNDGNLAPRIYRAGSLDDCVSGADVIVLPIPYTLDSRTINTPLSSAEIGISEVCAAAAQSNSLILGGKIGEPLKGLCADAGLSLADYSVRPEFEIMNAVPTAEGAIECAMANTPFTLNDSTCMVIGYGRIGKLLSKKLSALGADIIATARRHSDIAWIQSHGFTACKTNSLTERISECDIVFNTVPHRVLDFKALSAAKPGVLIIDLASRPGGVDFETAKELGRRVIWALSLPGKVAPYTAGKIIKDTILNIMEELEV